MHKLHHDRLAELQKKKDLTVAEQYEELLIRRLCHNYDDREDMINILLALEKTSQLFTRMLNSTHNDTKK